MLRNLHHAILTIVEVGLHPPKGDLAPTPIARVRVLRINVSHLSDIQCRRHRQTPTTKMFSRRSLHTLSAAERQFLRQQNARTGECIRCFHASRRQRAEGDGPAGSGKRNVGSDQGNDQGTPYNSMNSA